MLTMSIADKTSISREGLIEKGDASKDTNYVNNTECHSHPDNLSK